MKPFAEFCAHYELDPSSPEARSQYDAYCQNLALFRRAVAEQPEGGHDPESLIIVHNGRRCHWLRGNKPQPEPQPDEPAKEGRDHDSSTTNHH